MRQIVLDTETTGLEPAQGHRIIEIGCVEMQRRRLTGNTYHQYLQPEREIDDGAVEVHGITNEFLADKPRFADVVDDFLDYIRGAELIIHNAPFDVGFLNHELSLLGGKYGQLSDYCTVRDTLVMAREMHPGQRNSLDALCKRYSVDNSRRDVHGALLDSELLAEVYLALTGGQTSLSLGDGSGDSTENNDTRIRRLPTSRAPLPVITPSAEEAAAHQARLEAIHRSSGSQCLWLNMTAGGDGE